jgi:hypothetical protein
MVCSHLAGKPVLRGILGDVEVNNPSAVVAKNDQVIEQPKRRGGDHKHVDRRNVGQVIVQEASPGRGGDFGPPRYPPPDRGLADLDAELE